ncbi:hypothetical protein HQN60_04815 [Deefgea piscis]|uniref:Uncharacterized protein n=1 Tax=Deefgea piscis TaxID=2739061 RepID=A0A6M8SPJ8_9NEIS|nr:hypothetical protein [Deefgea piscis]QKJ66088.1 hypothetical protein HQN60_04815 [Deefgea piscis]
MPSLFSKLLNLESPSAANTTGINPHSPSNQLIEVHELDVESYISELCQLIAKNKFDTDLRQDYEAQLAQIARHTPLRARPQ